MVQGKVKWWADKKGYGFIMTENQGDVFVHYSNILGEGKKDLKEAQLVEFEIEEGPKGPKAVNVKVI